mgnify:CR=1 FL=1
MNTLRCTEQKKRSKCVCILCCDFPMTNDHNTKENERQIEKEKERERERGTTLQKANTKQKREH